MNKIEILGKNTTSKKILIISGVHGDELTPIYCTYLLSLIDYTKFDFHTITILSAINYDGIVKNTRDIPNTKTSDLNRMFTTEVKISEETELTKYINDNDIIIDIHSSPNCDEFVLINQDLNANSYIEFCDTHNIHYLNRYSSANTIKKYCMDLNKISFTLELVSIDYINYISAEKGKDIVLKIISECNNIIIKQSEPIYDTYIELQTYKSGLFIPQCKCGDIVSYRDTIGTILQLNSFEVIDIQCNLNFHSHYRIICFGKTNYVDGNNSVCFLQPIILYKNN
jgi:predicted deacylase